MLNLAIAPKLKKELLENMKVHPFSVSVDSSNDTELEKMHPMTIRIYNEKHGMIETQFLDMCTSRSAIAEPIYGVMNERLSTSTLVLESLLKQESSRETAPSISMDVPAMCYTMQLSMVMLFLPRTVDLMPKSLRLIYITGSISQQKGGMNYSHSIHSVTRSTEA